MCSGEWIEINGLELKARIGVPEIERETPQRLLVFLRFQIATPFSSLEDQLQKTVDYAGVATEVERIVESSQAHLMEKLVIDIGKALLERFPMRRLEIELRKFILPNTRYVSVRSDWQR
jgi:7,8-dihydroneopterin aldolase/epimerase/oxygenase